MRFDVEACKSIAFKMSLKHKSTKIPNKKKYQKKKERRNKKIRIWDEY